MRMRRTRLLALCGVIIALAGLSLPVMGITAIPQIADNDVVLELQDGTPHLCASCPTVDATIPLPTNRINETEIPIRLQSGKFDPLKSSNTDFGKVQSHIATSDLTLRLIQFPGPIQDHWFAAMIKSGLKIVAYIPDYTYIVWGDENTIRNLQSNVPMRWSGLYQPQYALHPRLQSQFLSQGPVEIVVQLYNYPGKKNTYTPILERASDTIRPPMNVLSYTNLALKVDTSDIPWITAQPGVVSVEPLLHPQLLDEIQGQILAGQLTANGAQPLGPGYLTWLTGTVGFPTTPSAYPIVEIVDDGIDDGDETPNHADFFEFGDKLNDDRLIYNANWTGDPTADGVGGHGNLNASIVGGYNDRSGSAYEDGDGYNYGLGINPFARIAGSKVFGNTSGWTNPVYADLLEYSYTQGARISSNSWGDDIGNGDYQTDDQIYDYLVRDAASSVPGNQEMTILFSAGNSGFLPNTIGSPGNAKNVITVGATENYRPTWIDGCLIGSTSANNANDIASFSSRGPTTDGRNKPDVVAPGTHIVGAATQITSYTGDYVCDQYYPVGQTLYAASSGTSHAAPAVAGAASLFYRYFKDHYDTIGSWPSPALTKAVIINSAKYLDGISSGDTLPSPNQGYGSVNLGTAFDGLPWLYEDQTKILQNSGESTTIRGYISDSAQPLRITLAWTDAPGAVTGDAYVNDLNLRVEMGGITYLGNVFSGGTSSSEGSADTRNNVESVFLPAGLQGSFEITILAENIAGDGVPGNGDPTDQDYALICYNCVRSDTFSLEINPHNNSICAADDAVYNLASTNYTEYPINIDLYASGYPTTSNIVFDPNPIIAGNQSVLTVSNTTLAHAGIYTLPITGETLTRTYVVTTQLRIYDGVPESTAPVSPPNMAIDIPLHPTLNWMPAAETNLFAVEIATDTTFTNLIYVAVTDTLTHTVQIDLSPETDYYWRIIPQNICGEAVTTEFRQFTTRAAPFSVTRNPEVPIPDNNSSGIFDTITITEDGTLIDMDVAISITHSWVGDLHISLEHIETGTLVNLLDRPGVTYPETNLGCMGDDIDIILDDDASLAVEDNCQNAVKAYPPGARYSPNESLVLFNGEAWKGTWRLTVSDRYAGDIGVLHQWSLMPTLSTSTDSTIALSQDTYSVSKTVPSAVITVTLDSTPASTVTVKYYTEPGSATPGTDYLTSTGILTFVHSPQQTFLVPILNNPDNTSSKTLTISLHSPTYGILTTPYTAPLHIIAEKQNHAFYLHFILRHYP